MKRFIAGAKCPECHQEDTLFFNSEDSYETVNCSRCSYHAKRSEQTQSSDDETNKEENIKWH